MVDEISSAVKSNTPCRDDETPEVKTAVSLERGENVDIKFENIVKGNTDENNNDDGDSTVFGF